MPKKHQPSSSQPQAPEGPEDGLLKIARTSGEMPHRLDRASPETLHRIHEEFLSAFRALEILVLTTTDAMVRETAAEQLKRMRQWAGDYKIDIGSAKNETRPLQERLRIDPGASQADMHRKAA